jgi:ABC-type glycerol-3-phosphate transport system substrate-binding protein
LYELFEYADTPFSHKMAGSSDEKVSEGTTEEESDGTITIWSFWAPALKDALRKINKAMIGLTPALDLDFTDLRLESIAEITLTALS